MRRANRGTRFVQIYSGSSQETHVKLIHKQDFWAGSTFLVAGLSFALGATRYSLGASARPGPGYFPLGLGVLLALLGAVVLVRAVQERRRGRGEAVGPIAWKPLLIVVASIAIFGAALPRLGLAISLPLLVCMIARAGDEFRWRDALLSSAVLTLGSWAVFILGLGLIIPVWPTFIAG
jgi:hypothetical protein